MNADWRVLAKTQQVRYSTITLHHLFELKILHTILGGQIVWTLGTIWNLLYRETTIPISECYGAVEVLHIAVS